MRQLARAQQAAALAEVLDDRRRDVARVAAVQPAVRLVEGAGLVDRHQHGQALALAQLEVLRAAARRDVDDARALVDADVVPRDHARLHLGLRRKAGERAVVGPPDELRAPCAAHDPVAAAEDGLGALRRRPTTRPGPASTATYSASGFTAAAQFAGSVHGVVVHTTSASPSASASGR